MKVHLFTTEGFAGKYTFPRVAGPATATTKMKKKGKNGANRRQRRCQYNPSDPLRERQPSQRLLWCAPQGGGRGSRLQCPVHFYRSPIKRVTAAVMSFSPALTDVRPCVGSPSHFLFPWLVPLLKYQIKKTTTTTKKTKPPSSSLCTWYTSPLLPFRWRAIAPSLLKRLDNITGEVHSSPSRY